MFRPIVCKDYYLAHWITEVVIYIVAAILTFVICFLEARNETTGKKKQFLKLLIPVNLLSMTGYSSMVFATFSLTTLKILNVTLLNITWNINSPYVIVKVAVTLTLIVLISLTYLPLLYCISKNNVFCNICGLLYVSLYVTLGIACMTPACSLDNMSVFQATTMFEFDIILIAAGGFLIVKFAWRLFGKGPSNEDVLNEIKLERIQYVKDLLYPAENHKSRRHICRNVPGFKYSMTILLTVSSGLFVVVAVLIVYIGALTENFLRFQNCLQVWKSNKTELVVPQLVDAIAKYILENELKDSEVEAVRLIYRFVDKQGTSIFVCSLIGFIVAAISAFYQAYALVDSYKPYKLNIQQRKSLENILKFQDLHNTHVVVKATQFAGTQTAHLIWGFHLQAGLIFLITLFITETVILPSESLLLIIINFLKLLTPLIIFVIMSLVVYYILVKKYFLAEKGNVFALNYRYRRGFLNVFYLMYFFYLFHGSINCMNRFIKWLFIGMWFYPRLDLSILPRELENRDSGHICFAALLKLENIEDNPIVHTFLMILSRDKIMEKHSVLNSNDCPRRLKFKMRNLKLAAKSVAHKRWFLAWTLLHNKSFCDERKRNYRANCVNENFDSFQNSLEV